MIGEFITHPIMTKENRRVCCKNSWKTKVNFMGNSTTFIPPSLVPDKYKVWYNKEKLIADYKRCNGSK